MSTKAKEAADIANGLLRAARESCDPRNDILLYQLSEALDCMRIIQYHLRATNPANATPLSISAEKAEELLVQHEDALRDAACETNAGETGYFAGVVWTLRVLLGKRSL